LAKILSDMAASARTLKKWVNAALALCYPEVCQLCGSSRAGPAEGFVCAGCRTKVRFIDPPFCERCGTPYEGQITTVFECANCRDATLDFCFARSAVIAREGVLDIIHRYKYHRALCFEPFLADLLLSRAVPSLATAKWDLIVPVPLHHARLREREFNQAECLAGHLGAATGIPVETSLLRRVVPTRTQTLLSRPERLANVRRAFSMRPGKSLDGQRIVLLDDVFTTGATTSACAKVLRAAGAGEVCVWTVARGA
jgi:ComF family protein